MFVKYYIYSSKKENHINNTNYYPTSLNTRKRNYMLFTRFTVGH